MNDETKKNESEAKIISIDEGKVREHLDGVVREAVEETLNKLLEAEADVLCGAARYERSAERVDTRAGSYERGLHTKAGEVRLKVPKLRTLSFETAIIERYKRRESSVEEALIEMYLAGVSVRRVEDSTEALWGTKVSASLVSDLNQRIYAQIEAWRKEPLRGEYACVYADGMWLRRSWGGEVKNVSVLIAVGVNAEGYREVLSGGRRQQGRQGELGAVPARDEGARAGRGEAVCERQMPWVPGDAGGLLSRGALAAVRGALVSPRVDGGADKQSQGSGGDAQGDPRTGRPGSGAGEGRGSGGEAAGDEAQGGG
jgi:hypothetical protein